jgi:hypothetical protein
MANLILYGFSYRSRILRIPHLPLAVDAFQRAPGRCNKRFLSGHVSVRNRKLGTAFRSPVTTLSPPLRGQRSWPAPSIPRISFAPIRSTESSPLGSVSKPKPGEFITFDPLSARCLRAPVTPHRLHSPSGRFDLPDQSVQRASSQEARLTGHPIFLSLPAAFLFRLRCGSTLKTPLRPAWLSFRTVDWVDDVLTTYW